MENSPFAKLSAKLRNQIYHLVLAHSRPIRISSSRNGDKIWSQTARRRKLLALTRACKTIREESVKIFYAINTFKHRAKPYQFPLPTPIRAFDTQIGSELAAVTRKVVVVRPYIVVLTRFDSWLGEDNVVLMARQLVDLASKNDTRTYKFRCTVNFTTIDGNNFRPLDFELSDMRNCEASFNEFKAGIRQKFEETDDLYVQTCLSKMYEKMTEWQARILQGHSSESRA